MDRWRRVRRLLAVVDRWDMNVFLLADGETTCRVLSSELVVVAVAVAERLDIL